MKQERWMQLVIGGFPFLIGIAVVAGLFVYYLDPEKVAERIEEKSGGGGERVTRAVPIDGEALGQVVRVFGQLAGGEGAITKTGKYLASSLGEQNTGYTIVRPLGGERPDAGWEVIEAVLEGESGGEAVVVLAEFGDALNEGAVAMLSVARAVVSDVPARGLRFVFLGEGEGVRERYEALAKRRGETVIELIEVGKLLGGETDVSAAQSDLFEAVRSRRISGTGASATAEDLAAVATKIEASVRVAAGM